MNKITDLIKDTILVVIGNALLAFGYASFAIPANLIVGGAAGIGLVINHFIPVDYTMIVFIINMVMLVFGYIFLGKKFVAGTLASSFLYPFFLKYFGYIQSIVEIVDTNLFHGGSIGIHFFVDFNVCQIGFTAVCKEFAC